MDYSFDASQYAGAAQGVSTSTMIFSLVCAVLALVAMCKLFSKAGEAGWKAIIPIYNIYIAFKLFWNGASAGLMTVLMFVPLVNIVIALILSYKIVASFGKGIGFFILSLLFNPIPQLILAFGGSQYIGPQ
ncbi:MAG: hypothetical protein IKQ91_09235 [Oscillospiraceae bacterium]|nr:hypothetical protein [Oscillospiraceae bacterium]